VKKTVTANQLQSARAGIFDGSIERRQVIARAWLARARSDLARLNDALRATARGYRETREAWTGRVCAPDEQPMVDIELQSQADRMRLRGIATTVLEVIFAGLVAAFSLSFNVYISSLAGALVAVLLVLAIEGVHLRLYRSDRPASSRAKVERSLTVSALIFGLGFIPFLVARTVPEAAVVANVTVAIATVGLTLTSAFLFILSFLLSWSRRFTRAYDALLQEIEETTQFAREVETLLRQKEARIVTFAR
jgi:hypothetical protein